MQCGARVCSTPADISGKTLLTAFFSFPSSSSSSSFSSFYFSSSSSYSTSPKEPPCHSDSGLRHRPAPETANDSAAAASARRSSAGGSVAGGSVAKHRLRGAHRQQSLEALCHWALLSLPLVSALETNRLENRPPSANSQLFLRPLAKPLAARRPKVPPPTSYTFALFSL